MDIISQQKQAIEGLLAENPSVGVIVSPHQNMDVVAAGLSLQLIFQDNGKNSQIVSPKEPIVEYSSLVGVDQLVKEFSGVTKTLTVSFPYKEGEIEKVSYNIEGDRLNVNLFGGETGITVQEKDIKYIKSGSSPSLLFVIGARDMSEIQQYVEGGARVVNIDNDVANTLYGDVALVDASYSSLSEMVAKLAFDLNLQVEFDVAQNMLDGISFATQNFSSPKTSPSAFEAAGLLLQKGAIRRNVKDIRPQTADTSLSMLGKTQPKPQMQPQKPFNQQNFPPKPFAQPQPKPQTQVEDQFDQYDDYVEEPQSQAAARPQPQPVQNPFAINQRQARPQDEEQSNGNVAENIPSEDEAPSDWFVPKVFKSTKD
ncbi:MAG: hypothetical protein ACM3IJ_06125 [Candidatus Levyibacteriota bacterium]